MEPNKFEKHIKNQLQEREIQPSEEAWERLSKKLDLAAPQSKKRGYFWYGMAASVIGLLIVSILYFSLRSPVDVNESQVVVVPNDTSETKAISDKEAEKTIEEAIVEIEKIESSSKLKETGVVNNQLPALKEKIRSSEEEVDALLAGSMEDAVTTKKLEDEIINTKILEIVAAVDSIEQNNAALTNAEVDDLLRSAQEEILREKLFSQNGSVDAMALLTEVEDELDQSFRDQIFESLKTGFLKVRTAVADRNK